MAPFFIKMAPFFKKGPFFLYFFSIFSTSVGRKVKMIKILIFLFLKSVFHFFGVGFTLVVFDPFLSKMTKMGQNLHAKLWFFQIYLKKGTTAGPFWGISALFLFFMKTQKWQRVSYLDTIFWRHCTTFKSCGNF